MPVSRFICGGATVTLREVPSSDGLSIAVPRNASRSMLRLCFTLLLPFALIAFVPAAAAPVPKPPADTTKDRDGNPLPNGATARLGSRPFHGTGLRGVAFSTDGKQLMAFADEEHVSVWDADTGKTLFQRS